MSDTNELKDWAAFLAAVRGVKVAYSPDSAAEAADVGRDQIFEAIREKKLVAKKSGRRTVIPADALIAWLNSLPEASAAA